MVLVLFRSKTTPAAGDDFAAMAGELVARAKTLPGFVDLSDYQAKNGEH
jgi:heme-degrading monooxygenase HmoA